MYTSASKAFTHLHIRALNLLLNRSQLIDGISWVLKYCFIRLTFGICWCKMITLGYTAAVGYHRIGAVVIPARRRHGWLPLAKKRPWCHGLWPSWCLHSPSVEHVICEAVILGVQIVLWWATVLRDTQWLLNYQCLLFGVFFLLLLSFLLFFLLTHLSTFIGIVTCIPTWQKKLDILDGKALLRLQPVPFLWRPLELHPSLAALVEELKVPHGLRWHQCLRAK